MLTQNRSSPHDLDTVHSSLIRGFGFLFFDEPFNALPILNQGVVLEAWCRCQAKRYRCRQFAVFPKKTSGASHGDCTALTNNPRT